MRFRTNGLSSSSSIASRTGASCGSSEVVKRGRAGGWETNPYGGRDASGRQCVAAAGEYLSPLRVRSVGSGMASKAGARRCDRRAVRGRHRGWVPEEADAQTVSSGTCRAVRKFQLELHPDKTRLLEFGPFAARNRKRRGEGKPETFDFLGFTHICGKKKEQRLLHGHTADDS